MCATTKYVRDALFLFLIMRSTVSIVVVIPVFFKLRRCLHVLRLCIFNVSFCHDKSIVR